MAKRVPAEVFPPGDFIREEMEALGWSQVDLAERLGCPVEVIGRLLSGRQPVTPQIALALEQAFGIGAQTWLNLEAAYQLHQTPSRAGAG